MTRARTVTGWSTLASRGIGIARRHSDLPPIRAEISAGDTLHALRRALAVALLVGVGVLLQSEALAQGLPPVPQNPTQISQCHAFNAAVSRAGAALPWDQSSCRIGWWPTPGCSSPQFFGCDTYAPVKAQLCALQNHRRRGMDACVQAVRAHEERTRAAQREIRERNALIAAREGASTVAQGADSMFAGSGTAQLIGSGSRIQSRVNTAENMLGFFSSDTPSEDRLRSFGDLASGAAAPGMRGNPLAGFVGAVGTSIVIEQHIANFREFSAAFDEFDRFMAGMGDNPSRGYSAAYSSDLARHSRTAPVPEGDRAALAAEAARLGESLGFTPGTAGGERSLAEESARLAAATGMRSGAGAGTGSVSLADEVALLEEGVRRWEQEQERLAQERAREEAERQRIARERAERRRGEQLAASRRAAEQSRIEQASRSSGSSWLSTLADIAVVAGQVYLQERYGVPALPPPSASASGRSGGGSSASDPRVACPTMEAEIARIHAPLENQRPGSICESSRLTAQVYSRMAAQMRTCNHPIAAAQADEFERYANDNRRMAQQVCAN